SLRSKKGGSAILEIAAPTVSRAALLSTTPGRGGHELQLADAEEAAGKLGVTVKPYRAATVPELQQALAGIAADGMNGLPGCGQLRRSDPEGRTCRRPSHPLSVSGSGPV